MKVGFLAWNQFQVGHFAEMAAQFREPDIILTDRDRRALKRFDPAWLTRYGAYTRFVRESDLRLLDGQYDAIFTQFTPPLARPWKDTRLVMCQYSMAKPKTAYNGRWLTSDLGLVYGAYSDAILGQMCPTVQVGNPRYDPFFEDRLDPRLMASIQDRLDPRKKTVLFLPTWGDLNARAMYDEALTALAKDYNVLFRPHHLTQIRGAHQERVMANALSDGDFEPVLDIGPYFMKAADLVISDMSGAIYDALYCDRPVVLLGLGADYAAHKKADPTALEIVRQNDIGPLVSEPDQLLGAVAAALAADSPYRARNAALVAESFARRGGCAPLVRGALEDLMADRLKRPPLNLYVKPNVSAVLVKRAHTVAMARIKAEQAQNEPRPSRMSRLIGRLPKKLVNPPRRLVALVAGRTAAALDRRAPSGLVAGLHGLAGRNGRMASLIWSAQRADQLGDAQAARRLYQQASKTSGQAQREYLRLLSREGEIFAVGLAVEAWMRLKPRDRSRAFISYFGSATRVRFSQMLQRDTLKTLLEYWQGNDNPMQAQTRAKTLRDMGLISTAVAAPGASPTEIQTREVVLDHLGDMVGHFEIAAENEFREADALVCVAPDRTLVPIRETAPGSVFEFSYMRNLTRGDQDYSQGMRRTSVAVTRAFESTVLDLGYNLLPRIQGSARSASMITGRYPAMSWHTIDVGVPGHIHLKMGALPEHVIIDRCGYSGWSSIANTPLDDMIRDVDAVDAEAQFAHLRQTLVQSGKSKFTQSVDAAPTVKDYVFLPMQVLDDTVARHADIDCLSLLNLLADWGARTGRAVVVKRHPLCVFESVASAIRTLSQQGRIIVSNASVHDLIADAAVVVTVNSGVGAEALLHLKPVISTGGSDYAAATLRARTPEALAALLDGGDWRAAPDLEIKKFLWFFTKRYMPHYSDADAIRQRVAALVPARAEEAAG